MGQCRFLKMVSVSGIMINELEKLPNELLLMIFAHFSWDELLTSVWSLNHRLNSLICAMFASSERGITVDGSGLSYRRDVPRLSSPFLQSAALCASVRHLHLNGLNSMSHDLFDQWLFQKNELRARVRFPNLKSIRLSRCFLSEALMKSVAVLIGGKLTDLRLDIDEDQFGSPMTTGPSVQLIATRRGMFHSRGRIRHNE